MRKPITRFLLALAFAFVAGSAFISMHSAATPMTCSRPDCPKNTDEECGGKCYCDPNPNGTQYPGICYQNIEGDGN